MNALLQAILQCFGQTSNDELSYNPLTEKPELGYKDDADDEHTEEIAANVVHALFTAEKPGRDLELKINNIVGTYSWTERLSVAVVHALEEALRKGKEMASAIKEAVEKATRAAEEFVREHPVETAAAVLTLVAIFVLPMMAPWVIRLLGFTRLGPAAGKKPSFRETEMAVGLTACRVMGCKVAGAMVFGLGAKGVVVFGPTAPWYGMGEASSLRRSCSAYSSSCMLYVTAHGGSVSRKDVESRVARDSCHQSAPPLRAHGARVLKMRLLS